MAAAEKLSAMHAVVAASADPVALLQVAFPRNSFVSPTELMVGCERLGVRLNAFDLRALLEALASGVTMPAERVVDAILRAQLPPPSLPPPPAQLEDSEPQLTVPPQPPHHAVDLAPPGFLRPMNAVQTEYLSADEERRRCVRATKAAPFSTLDAGIAPMFEATAVRPPDASPRCTHWHRDSAASTAAREALFVGKGAAGKGSTQSHASAHDTLLQARALTASPRVTPPPHMPPYALDQAVGPLPPAFSEAAQRRRQEEDEAAARARAARPATAPYATLSPAEVGQLVNIDRRQSQWRPSSAQRVGPTLWSPPENPTPPHEAAGCLPQSPRDGMALPSNANWSDPVQTRPVSRRAAGRFRPQSTGSQIMFG